MNIHRTSNLIPSEPSTSPKLRPGRTRGRWLVLALTVAIAGLAGTRASDLFFSEYVEGSSNNKALEIYNGTGTAVNLSGYGIEVYFNGATTPGLTIALPNAVLPDADVFILAQSSADPTILAKADLTNGSGWFNGDDAVVLKHGSEIIDAIGQIGFDPGAEWGTGLTSTGDNTLRRKSTVLAGDTNPNDVFDPSAEWDGFAQNTFDGLGTHTVSGFPTLALLVVPNSVSEGAGAAAAQGTVTRSGDTTSPLTVSLASSDISEATVPATVTILAGQASVAFAIDAIDDTNVDGSQAVTLTASASGFASGTTSLTVLDDDAGLVTLIHDIQGGGITSPLEGATVTIEGIVVGRFTGLNGFFVQEEDADEDADPSTSEGIFVFDNNSLFTGTVGTRVRVMGSVAEYASSAGGITGNVSSSLTQLSGLTSVTELGTAGLPTAASVTLPVADPSDLERYEGMFVQVSSAAGSLTVTETFKLGRYGQVGLSGDGRLDQFTQVNLPSVSGYAAHLANLRDNYIILDDGNTAQNPDPVIHARGGSPLSALNTLRAGDTVAGITGVLDERYEGYRVQSSSGADFQPGNPRPDLPSAVGGSLRVASVNLLNFFNGDGQGGGFPTSRGATTLTEFQRQLDKTVAALVGLDADILGYNEMENDGYGANSAVQQLVNAMNAATAPGSYAFVTPPPAALNPAGGLGGDEIAVGFIYKPAAVQIAPGSTVSALTTGIFAQDTANLKQRPPLAVAFATLGDAPQSLSIVVNHFKSKGSSAGTPSDEDAGDGQGLSNATRTLAAQQLADWLATDPTGIGDPDILIVGDLNAYRMEDPIATMIAAGYPSLFGPESYSYQFNGQWGSLDHALASPSLLDRVTGATKWHINADEPVSLDYNVEFKSTGQVASFYNADPFRTSDHDPILIGLSLGNLPPLAAPYLMGCWRDQDNTLSTDKLLLLCTDPNGDELGVSAVSATSAAGGTLSLAGTTITYTPAPGFSGTDTFTYTIVDAGGLTASATATVQVRDLKDQGLSVLGPPVLAGNTFTVRFAGIPGLVHEIEACDDLSTAIWVKIGESTAGTFGLFEFVDPDAPSHATRYYRSRQP